MISLWDGKLCCVWRGVCRVRAQTCRSQGFWAKGLIDGAILGRNMVVFLEGEKNCFS